MGLTRIIIVRPPFNGHNTISIIKVELLLLNRLTLKNTLGIVELIICLSMFLKKHTITHSYESSIQKGLFLSIGHFNYDGQHAPFVLLWGR